MIPMGREYSRSSDPTNRVQELTWAMVDDHLADAEWSELQKLLTDSAESRHAYIDAIQLHTDLLFHFQNQSAREVLPVEESTPVLGFLGDPVPVESPLASS